MPHADWSRYPSLFFWPVTGRARARTNCTGDQAKAEKEKEPPQQFRLLLNTVPVTQHSLKSSSSMVLGIAVPGIGAAVVHQTLQSEGEESKDKRFFIVQDDASDSAGYMQRVCAVVMQSSTEHCRARLRHNCAVEVAGPEALVPIAERSFEAGTMLFLHAHHELRKVFTESRLGAVCFTCFYIQPFGISRQFTH